MGIRKRNLEDSLLRWIQEQSGLPLGMGDVKYVAATTAWRSYLYDNGYGSTIYSNPKTAYDNCTAGQNDVVVVFPGSYDFGDVWTWAKDSTHMICIGPVGMTNHPVTLYHALENTETGGQFVITASNCFFKNFKLRHRAANNSSAGAVVNVNFKGCSNIVCDHVQFANHDDTILAHGADSAQARGVKLTGAVDMTFSACVFGGIGTVKVTDTAAASAMWWIPDSSKEDSGLLETAFNRNLRFYNCAWETLLDSDSTGLYNWIKADDTRVSFKGLVTMENCVFSAVAGATGVIANGIALDTQVVEHGRILLRNPLVIGATKLCTDSESLYISQSGWDSGAKGTGLAIKPTA